MSGSRWAPASQASGGHSPGKGRATPTRTPGPALPVSFARRTGHVTPGAGRPAKLYQRSVDKVSASLPPRHYDLAGHLLAGALAQAQQSGEPPRQLLDQRARAFGQAMAREQSGWREQPEQREQSGPAETGALMSLLEAHGCEPRLTGSDIVLHNCPFHALAQEHPDLVCGMNLHLIEGALEGSGAGVRARLGTLARLRPYGELRLRVIGSRCTTCGGAAHGRVDRTGPASACRGRDVPLPVDG
jgi:predicted ArsR family transcriptional regulator